METSKPTPDGPEMPGLGIARDLRQLKTHSAATAAELREFLAQARGRSPQEVLGMVAGSSLTRSVAVATLGAVVVLAAGTLLPWLMGGSPADAKAAKAEAVKTAPAEPKRVQEPTIQTAASPPASSAAPVTPATPSQADAEKAVKAMGMGDTKIADPKTNPLEKNLDNLLDKLE